MTKSAFLSIMDEHKLMREGHSRRLNDLLKKFQIPEGPIEENTKRLHDSMELSSVPPETEEDLQDTDT